MKIITPSVPKPPDPQKVIRKFVAIISKLQGSRLPPARPRRVRKTR